MPIKTAIGLHLSVIPPANRRLGSRGRLSNLSARPSARAKVEGDGFKPQVIALNEHVRRQRKVYQQALAAKAQQLEALIAQAEQTGGEAEAAYWRGELAKLAQG